MNTLGLYVHIPFCKSKCRYCDFCSFPNPKSDRIAAYLDALCGEIDSYGAEGHPYHADAREREVDTVYFGGGTPTLLEASQLARVMEAIRGVFRIREDTEITAECNPATADLAYFKALRATGFNRLSIGAQSMQQNELRLLGRLHSADDVRKTVADAREAGFENISVDLMFGIPDQTEDSLAITLDAILALSPDHVSLYGLQIEEGTYLHRHRDTLHFPDEDTEGAMYEASVRRLGEAGIYPYEISNFARTGFASRHNLRYWRRLDYLGLGVAAHSCMGDHRFSNTENLDAYLAGDRRDEDEIVSSHDVLCERVMLGMRLREGVDFAPLLANHGEDARRIFERLSAFAAGGHIARDGHRLAFTTAGAYVSNAILADALDFDA